MLAALRLFLANSDFPLHNRPFAIDGPLAHSLLLLDQIFLTQENNEGDLHSRLGSSIMSESSPPGPFNERGDLKIW